MLACFSKMRKQHPILFFVCFLTIFSYFFSSYSFAIETREKERKRKIQTPQSHTVDLVVFSYDRPLQLYAFLESWQKHCSGAGTIHVIYRASNEDYHIAYMGVKTSFPKIIMHKQGTEPSKDFQPLVLASTYQSSAKYVMFAVDDNIVIQKVNLAECIYALEKTKAWGFFLRLGKNINFTYTLNKPTLPPQGKQKENLFVWQFTQGQGDWNYPNNVDLTIYRKSDIKKFLTKSRYTNPNSLEQAWQKHRPSSKSLGVCYEQSKGVNIPLNIVNPSSNRHMNLYTPQDLLYMFEDGLKIDISQLENRSFNSFHVAVEPMFIDR